MYTHSPTNCLLFPTVHLTKCLSSFHLFLLLYSISLYEFTTSYPCPTGWALVSFRFLFLEKCCYRHSYTCLLAHLLEHVCVFYCRVINYQNVAAEPMPFIIPIFSTWITTCPRTTYWWAPHFSTDLQCELLLCIQFTLRVRSVSRLCFLFRCSVFYP